MTDPFREWAGEYSKEVGELPPSHHPAAQRARLLFAYRKTQTKGFARNAYWALGAGLLLVAGAALWWAPSSINQAHAPSAGITAPLLGSVPVNAGQAILASESPKTLTFEGGTRATFASRSSGSLAKLSQDAVEVTLDEGLLEMDVEREERRSWVVRSGKFRVYVIGTAFTIRREAVSEKLKVHVKRGQVRIEGPGIKGRQLVLGAGQEFEWQPAGKAPSTAQGPASATRPNAAPGTSEPSGKTSKDTSSEGARPTDRIASSWQTLARAGKYELALEEVERLGVDHVLGQASSDDRLLLGNAARYSGRIELGSRAYLAARNSEGAAAPLAAYYLAKIALDSNGDQSGAIRWLQTYLREAPHGDLAVSARARLMNLLQATGRHAEAKKVAKEYLALHPSGPNARTAQQLLEQN